MIQNKISGEKAMELAQKITHLHLSKEGMKLTLADGSHLIVIPKQVAFRSPGSELEFVHHIFLPTDAESTKGKRKKKNARTV